MNKTKHTLLLLVATLLPMAISAQVINGDLNHNNSLDVGDVTLLIDGYLTGETELVQTGGAPFSVDNSYVVGTWYKSSTESITFREDGTTDYMEGYTYKFLPLQGYLQFYDSNAIPVYAVKVTEVTADYLAILPAGSNVPIVYTVSRPVSITLSATSLEMKSDEISRLTVTVVPTDAGTVTWSSSDESVATVASGFVTAIAEGTAVITATVGTATATCTVTVTSASTYEAVDLGLSVKWATMNIGASAPEEYGDYFAWGETTAKTDYSWSTYKWANGNDSYLTKYCTNSYLGPVDNKTVLEQSDDAAHQNWGSKWRMPTKDEFEELLNKCTWTWSTLNGVNGYVVKASNGNSIFLPAAGFFNDSPLERVGDFGIYWSSSLDDDDESYPNNAWFLETSWSYFHQWYGSRHSGYSIRAVCE